MGIYYFLSMLISSWRISLFNIISNMFWTVRFNICNKFLFQTITPWHLIPLWFKQVVIFGTWKWREILETLVDFIPTKPLWNLLALIFTWTCYWSVTGFLNFQLSCQYHVLCLSIIKVFWLLTIEIYQQVHSNIIIMPCWFFCDWWIWYFT